MLWWFLFVWSVNMAIGLFIRFFGSNDEIKIKMPDEYSDRPILVLLAGYNNQATNAFHEMEHCLREHYDLIYINYPNYGWDPIKIGVELNRIEEQMKRQKCIFVGISLACKAILSSGVTRAVLINPCIHPGTLTPEAGKAFEFWFRADMLVSVLLGCLAFLPVLGELKNSWAARASQGCWVVNGECFFGPKDYEWKYKGVVISNGDDVISSKMLKPLLPEGMLVAEIDTEHAATTEEPEKYANAILSLVSEILKRESGD